MECSLAPQVYTSLAAVQRRLDAEAERAEGLSSAVGIPSFGCLSQIFPRNSTVPGSQPSGDSKE